MTDLVPLDDLPGSGSDLVPESDLPQGISGVGRFESGGNGYTKQHPVTGAHGKYQIMPSNWSAWAQDAGLPWDAPKTPQNQEVVAQNKWNEYLSKFGDETLAAAAWFAGPSAAAELQKGNTAVLSKKDANGVTVANYIKKTTGRDYNTGNNVVPASDLPDQSDLVPQGDLPGSTDKTFWDRIKEGPIAAGETLATLATGGLAWPVSKIVGHATQLYGGVPEDKARMVEAELSKAMTYQPRTEAGQEATDIIGQAMEALTAPSRKLGQAVGSVAPGLGYPVQTAAELATFKGIGEIGRGLRGKGKGKAEIPPREEIGKPVKADVFDETLPETAPRMPQGVPSVTEPTNQPGVEIKASDRPLSIEEPPVYTPTGNPFWDKANTLLEAQVKGGSTQPLDKYAEGSAINLDRLDTTLDVKQFINQQTKVNEARIGKHVQTWDETRQQAEALGWNWKSMVRGRKGRAYTAAEIDAMRQINMNMATDLVEKIKNIPADRNLVTPEMRLELADAMNNYGEVLKTLSSASSEAGRALNIHKKLLASNPEFAAASNFNRITKTLLDQSGLTKLTDSMLDDLKGIDLTDVKAVNQLIQKYHRASIGDMFYEGWMNGLLSSPVSHVANILSNTLTFLTKPALETPATAAFELFRGKNRQAFFGETPAELVGAWQGMKDGARAALLTWKTGIGSDIFTKTEIPRLNAIPGRLGENIRIPTRALSAADEFFKAVVYRSELNRQAYAKAASEGFKGRERAGRMAELLSDPGKFLDLEKAHSETLYRTFNDPLGPVGTALMTLRNNMRFNVGRYIVPFMRTPVNVVKFGMERTPLNLAKIADDLHSGKLKAKDITPELAKVTVGTGLSLAVVELAAEGYITGSGPKDRTKREILYRQGWQPYSFKIGDAYYGFNRLEPIGSIAGMAADFAELIADPYKESHLKNFVAGKIAGSITKNITNKTFVQGMSNMLDALSDFPRYGQKFIQGYAGTLIPGIVAQGARAIDPYYHDPKTVGEYMQSRIPGASMSLPTKPSIYGGPQTKGGNPFTRFVLPIPISNVPKKEAP